MQMHILLKINVCIVICYLGKTKAAAIAHNVLAPASLQAHLKYLTEKNVFYSISSDASNHKNRKMFPLVLRYYCPGDDSNNDVKCFLLDFYEVANETAAAIFESIKVKLNKFGLKLDNITGYSGDNANVNFGCNNSVFTRLHGENENILPLKCPTHLIHNSVHYALDRCPFDVENVVLKTYNFFSIHAKRSQILYEFCTVLEVDQQNLLRHVSTRWLSLLKAAKRLQEQFEPLKCYFESPESNSTPFLNTHFVKNCQETEVWLYFLTNALQIFNNTVMFLERKNILCGEVFIAMANLRTKINQRIVDRFFGSVTEEALELMSNEEKVR